MNVNGVIGMFPLSLIRPFYKDYYMDANGNVYSTKQRITPQLMKGTSAPRGGRLYTFTSTNPANRLPANERGDVLFAEAKRHPSFALETNLTTTPAGGLTTMPAMALKSAAKLGERNHAASTRDGIAQKGYIIGRLEGEAIVFGSKPMIHTTLKSVKSEVERLAQANPGKMILYVKIEGSAIANGIAWA